MGSPPQQLPEPSFAVMVNQLYTQAMIELGVIPNPLTGESSVAAPRALFTIRMLEMLRHKTVGNLDAEEQVHLERALSELKVNYDSRAHPS
jgi:hypothetical protein